MTRFRAERRRMYFLIAYDMKVISTKEEGCGMDELAYNSGNYFETKAEAETVAAKFRAILDEHHNQRGGLQ